jgi:hypothetical protein
VPTRLAATLASILTSLLFGLGRPNFPATKKGTEVPLIGTFRASVSKRPVVLLAEHYISTKLRKF